MVINFIVGKEMGCILSNNSSKKDREIEEFSEDLQQTYLSLTSKKITKSKFFRFRNQYKSSLRVIYEVPQSMETSTIV